MRGVDANPDHHLVMGINGSAEAMQHMEEGEREDHL